MNKPTFPKPVTLDQIEIRAIRSAFNMFRPEFARFFPTNEDTIYAWETGRRNPGPIAMARLNDLKKYADHITAGKRKALRSALGRKEMKFKVVDDGLGNSFTVQTEIDDEKIIHIEGEFENLYPGILASYSPERGFDAGEQGHEGSFDPITYSIVDEEGNKTETTDSNIINQIAVCDCYKAIANYNSE